MKKTLSQRSWEWIKEQSVFTSKQLAAAMDVELRQAQGSIDHLIRKGGVVSGGWGKSGAKYSPIPGATPHLPGKNTTSARNVCIRQKIWQAMRFHQNFTIDDIVASVECARSNVNVFVAQLCRYEYVKKTRGISMRQPMSNRRGASAKYLLLKNTGHRYPVIWAGHLRDQNTGKIIPDPTKQQEADHELAGTA